VCVRVCALTTRSESINPGGWLGWNLNVAEKLINLSAT